MQQLRYELATEVEGDHLFARVSGSRTRDTVAFITVEIADAALAAHLSKVLVDVTELKGRLGVLDSYLVVTQTFEKLRGKGIRRAAVVDEGISSSGGWFLETVAHNRVFNFRVFTDREDALKWLSE